MYGTFVASSETLSVLGVSVSREASYMEHVKSIVKETAQNQKRYFLRARKYYSAENLLTLNKAHMRPQMENFSNTCSSEPKILSPTKRFNSERGVKLLNNHFLTAHLHSLEHIRKVGDFSTDTSTKMLN